jgi:xanthine dehydrogenase accessory factor
MPNIYQIAAEFIAQGKPCALVTVIRTSGSVPRRKGSKMLVSAHGELLAGTIGGGEMENRVLQACVSAINTGKPSTHTERLMDPGNGDAGVCGGTVEMFIEPLLNTPTLLVVGAGHVGRALVHLAKWAGFRVLLTDDRSEICTPAVAPGADVYLPGPLAKQLAQVELTANTFVALVTRGYPIDVNLLPMLLASPVAYIGVIGSQRRWLTAKEALLKNGTLEQDLARVRAPIGIEIHAETPEEIAVSIVAEMIGVLRG